MLIQETKDYEVFQHFDWNRQIHEGNIKKLMQSISQHNMLKSKPILIDEEFRVLDGKHRLESARRLQVPIWYQVHEKMEENDIIRLNNAVKSWSIPDYLNFYSKKNYPNYMELEKFINNNKLDVNIALHLLNADRSTGFYKEFKDGLYQFPDPEKYILAVNKKSMIDDTIEFIKKKTSGNKIYLERVTFYGALVEFFSNEAFSYEVFNKKLQYKIDLIHPCSKRAEYLKILKDIYNWKNHSPIEKL